MSLDVIGAGNGRTGTLSLKLALERLGFGRCYHMTELMADPSRLHHWEAAFAGEEVDWESLFDGYRSVTDYPGFYFHRQLAERYPNSKVVLTTRPADEWYESARQTIYTAKPRGFDKLKLAAQLPFNAQLRSFLPVFKIVDYMWDVIFEGRFEDRDYAMKRFEQMNDDVIRATPPDRLLVYQLGQGWDPLCEFLGVDVPDEPFPRTNERAGFEELLRTVRKGRLPDHNH